MRICNWSSYVCSSVRERHVIGLNPHRSIRFYIPERGGGEIAHRLADARPRFGKEHVGLIAVRARGEAGGRRLSIGALTRPLLCPLPSQTAEAIRHFLVIQGNGARLSTGRLLLPFRQLGEQPALCPFGCSDELSDEFDRRST